MVGVTLTWGTDEWCILEEENDESHSDDSLIQELEDQVKTLNERNKALNLTCAQLTRKSLDYLKQIKELEEDKRKNISMLAQGNEKFEKMLKMGKEYGDMTGLGYSEAIASSSTQRPKNGFVKAKGSTQPPPQPSHKGKEKVEPPKTLSKGQTRLRRKHLPHSKVKHL